MNDQYDKMVFFNVGWMQDYKGDAQDDIKGGGSHIAETGGGGEVFNFKPMYDDYIYGYVQPSKATININRIGLKSEHPDFIDVLVVWCARQQSGGTFIVGWYKNATVYRDYQVLPNEFDSDRIYKDKKHNHYFVKAKVEDCTLLPYQNRTKKIIRGVNGMGRSHVWFADKAENVKYKEGVIEFIRQYEALPEYKKNNIKPYSPRQMNPEKKAMIEKSAIEQVTLFYQNMGYKVVSYEKDNLGYDLEVSNETELLMVEVKGLSQNEIRIELTPNEYSTSQDNENSYRICVVTCALSDNPVLSVFAYVPQKEAWIDDNGNELKIQERIAVVMTLKGCCSSTRESFIEIKKLV